MILTLFFSVNAFAATPLVYNTVLGQPVESRVKFFREHAPDGEKYLVKLSADPHAGIQARWRALTTLGRMDAKRFMPTIEAQLKSKDWYMRNAGLIALQSASRDVAVKWSMALATDPALVVRTQAVRNLVRLNAHESEALLWREIFAKTNFNGRESLWVRAHMAEALARFAGPGRAKLFEKLLRDPDERLHKWAVMGLESTTGFKMTTKEEPVEIRRQKWLSRLGGAGLQI